MKRLILILNDEVHTFDTEDPSLQVTLTHWNEKQFLEDGERVVAAIQIDSKPSSMMPYSDWVKP